MQVDIGMGLRPNNISHFACTAYWSFTKDDNELWWKQVFTLATSSTVVDSTLNASLLLGPFNFTALLFDAQSL